MFSGGLRRIGVYKVVTSSNSLEQASFLTQNIGCSPEACRKSYEFILFHSPISS
jgi:hypothetical protein